MYLFHKKRYIIGVSGGPDSMALLSYYKKYVKAVCVVNYNKRQESNSEVELVKQYCKKYNLNLEIKEVDPQIYSQTNENFQTLARKIRYDFFYEIAKKYNANYLLIAHHFDDFLETAYMQKTKKSKSLFYGINKYSNWKDLKIYRPFVTLYNKQTLITICNERKVPFAIDSSNNSDDYERNRVRKIISSWDTNKKYYFYKEIKQYNKENKKKLNKIKKEYLIFKNSLFDLSNFNNLDADHKYYLIYEYLKEIDEKNKNEQKINSIIQFIDSKNHKQYRLESNKFISIINNKLNLINENNIKIQD